jgi:hypothetical protein
LKVVQLVTKVQQKCGEKRALGDFRIVKIVVEIAVYAGKTALAKRNWQLALASKPILPLLPFANVKEIGHPSARQVDPGFHFLRKFCCFRSANC